MHRVPDQEPPASQLGRFIQAQAADFHVALAELERGRKNTHWIWYVFPQLRGLGVSGTSRTYGIAGLEEAKAYLAHPVLGPRLRECIEAMLTHHGLSASRILGDVDALKFRSCLTLFRAAAPSDTLFHTALDRFYDGLPDDRTLALLAADMHDH